MKNFIPKKAYELLSLGLWRWKFALIAFAFLQLSMNSSLAQTNQVSGRVTSETGEGLPGVNIVLKGTNKGTTTDSDGKYAFAGVDANSVLIFSFIGYTTQEIVVGNQTTINVQLMLDMKTLSEVVVVGYGTQKKADVTGAITSVSETALREVPVANLQQALQGRAAGLEIQRTGTRPGAGAQIRIRGTRSISGSNEPLIVLDGIPFDGSLNDINPNDVASIEVLKDASATAIYGSRGANGILLITSKKGETGDTKVFYNGYHGIGTVANKYPLFSATEYQAMRNISPWAEGYMPEELKSIQTGRTTDWQDLMYQGAYRTDHNLTISGGTKANTFSLGAGYFKETALLPGQDFTRFNLRTAIDSKIGKRISVGISSINSLNITNGSQFVVGGTMYPILSLSPLMPSRDSLGNVYKVPSGNILDNVTYNPLYLKENNNNWVDRVRRLRTFNSLYGEYEFFEGLKYRLNLGLSYEQQESAQFQASDLASNPSYFRPQRGNTAFVNNSQAWGYTLENLLIYDKTIAQKHRVNFTGLYSIQEGQFYNTSVRKDSITDNFVQFYNLALSTPINSSNTALGGGESKSAIISYMGRLNYAYNDKYLLTVTGRRDGSSRLAVGNKWFNYGAVSAGWNITNEDFMQDIKLLTNLKLRAGYGVTSNQSVGIYSSLGLVSNNNGLGAPGNILSYNFGNTILSGYQVSSLPNANLSWEFSKTTNIGVDFGIWENRITGSIEYYHQKTDRIIYGVSLPATSGVTGNFQTNIGEMENKGFEFSISSVNVRLDNGFTWSMDINLFTNRNRILKLSNNVQRDIANQLHVGYSMTSIYDFKKLGIWQIDEAAEAARFGARPGQIKLLDYSGRDGVPDGVINDFDRHIIGNADAKLQGGMTHRINYKGFDFSTVFYARFGGLLISQIHQPDAAYLTNLDGRRNGIKVDYWTPTNPSNWFPMPGANRTVSTEWTTLGYYDASFVKIRSINFGYTFNKNILNRFGMNSVRTYFTIDNAAILFSPYFRQTGIDPEGTGTGNQGVSNPGNIRGGANGVVTISASTPPARTFTFGLNISL